MMLYDDVGSDGANHDDFLQCMIHCQRGWGVVDDVDSECC